ncbi:bifunctional 2-polyprenyl-6-hydroxyphenol methylase/3-demethylubiquinol 3-O-methyltransferase UbiG [Glycomyces sp. NRRL B-16210]|uniref:class I SAM-dependent methyltransferase n=1 Tax=Glycomyces sp. NRRL B-16210 TaxID=1463821 RepID=UPI0004C180C4|nr:class I SAM-dependent methyltransferase [Glycomyces sp. NRRL B-16210]
MSEATPQPEPKDAAWIAANRAMWDERVPIHAASEFYDQAGFRAGADRLNAFEVAEVGDVTGKRLVHLQCHMGQDTLSWARRGTSRVVGLDFSEPAVEVARGLAADLGFTAAEAEFVAADVYDAKAALPEADYDIVYTGLGALCWLPDIERWAEVASSLVAPGGFLYLAEFHPVSDALDWDTGNRFDRDYLGGTVQVYDEPGTYVDGDADTVNNLNYLRIHPIGEVVTALAANGLRLEFLHEFDWTLFQQFGTLVKDEEGYRQPEGAPRAPLMYSLKATRPA